MVQRDHVACEQPAHVGIPEGVECVLPAGFMKGGRVRVARAVAEGMVFAMGGDPFQRRLLHGECTQAHPEGSDRRGCLEGAVRQHAMVANCDSQAGHIDADKEDQKLRHVQVALLDAPGHCYEETDNRADNADHRGQFMKQRPFRSRECLLSCCRLDACGIKRGGSALSRR